MAKLFLDVLNLSIAASWLIFAVLILRLMLKRFVPKWTVCLVWALVGIRLVIPFSFESELSLVPSRETVNTDALLYAEESALPKESLSSAEKSIFVSEALTDGNPTAEPTLSNTSTLPQQYIDSGFEKIDKTVNPIIQNAFEENRGEEENAEPKWLSVASIIWVLGIGAMLAYAVINYLLLKRRVSAFVPEENGIRKSENVESPFILGVFKPRIYLPFGLSEENERNIIAHERAHLARGDHLIKPFGFTVLAFYWFNPLCWIAYIILCRDIELACDERVVRNMDAETRKGYAKALLECGMKRSFVSACPVAFGEVGIKERVINALNYKKPIFWIIIVAIALITAVALLFLTNPTTEESLSAEIGSEQNSQSETEESGSVSSEEQSNSSEETEDESLGVSNDIIDISNAITEDSSDISETSNDASDGADESSEDLNESSEDSNSVTDDSSEIIDDSSEVADDSSEIIENSSAPVEPEVSEPEVSEPEISEPEVSEPEASEPENQNPMKNTSHQTPDTLEYNTNTDAVCAYVRISDIEIATYGGGEEDALIKERGLKVWLCDNLGNKIDYLYTNSDGVAFFYLEEGAYHFAFEGNGKYTSAMTINTFEARKDKHTYRKSSPDEVVLNTFREIYNKNLTITVTDIETGKPIKDVKCTVGEYRGKVSAATDENGIAVLPPAMRFFSRDKYIYAKFECEGYEAYECWEIAIRDNEAHIQLKKSQE